MEIDEAIAFCLSLPNALEETPFGPEVLVYKIAGKKVFALVGERKGLIQMNLKCQPDKAIELRSIYPSIIPGYHMNKRHWNTLIFDHLLPSDLIKQLIEESYQLVFQSLPKATQRFLSD